jgi:hypothetical protein
VQRQRSRKKSFSGKWSRLAAAGRSSLDGVLKNAAHVTGLGRRKRAETGKKWKRVINRDNEPKIYPLL